MPRYLYVPVIKYIGSPMYNQINPRTYMWLYMIMGMEKHRVPQMPPYSQVLGSSHPKYSC